MDGQVTLIDRRVSSRSGDVGRLLAGDKAPPWCMSVSFTVLDAPCYSNTYVGMLVEQCKPGPRGKT
jgi:hypothetical protein